MEMLVDGLHSLAMIMFFDFPSNPRIRPEFNLKRVLRYKRHQKAAEKCFGT